MYLLVDGIAVSQNSVFANTSDATCVPSADATLLEIIDRLGLAKYARIFVEQEVFIFFITAHLARMYRFY